jgi:hypothetical protein
MSDNFFNLNNPDFYGAMLRFTINLIFLIIFIRYVYFRYTKKEKFVFTFFLMGIMVFLLTSALNSVLMQLSMGFGLFAIFAILRFRTRNFSLKDMSYIFTVIGLSVINSLKLIGFPVLGIVIFNIIVIITAIILEKFSIKYNTTTHSIIYENLEMLKSDRKQKLLKDVSELTGREILRIKIRKIDYKKKVALLDIYYKD